MRTEVSKYYVGLCASTAAKDLGQVGRECGCKRCRKAYAKLDALCTLQASGEADWILRFCSLATLVLTIIEKLQHLLLIHAESEARRGAANGTDDKVWSPALQTRRTSEFVGACKHAISARAGEAFELDSVSSRRELMRLAFPGGENVGLAARTGHHPPVVITYNRADAYNAL